MLKVKENKITHLKETTVTQQLNRCVTIEPEESQL